nr:reverse transcriptase domain-containing protein [Tanacetum cinerariifolium]
MEPKICSYSDASKSRIGMCVPTKRQGDCYASRSWGKIYFAVLVNIAEGIGNKVKHAYDLSSSNERTKKCGSPVLWAEIGEIQSIGPELVQETTNKVVLIKEKLKAARDCQKSYVGNRRKHLEL